MSIKRLSFREKLSYGMGDLGNGFMFDMGQLYLLFFYTNYMKISPVIAGSVFLVAKIADAFIDTAVGAFVDTRVPGKLGKFRPFILFGSFPLAILTTICFVVPNFGETGRVVWAFATYILFNAAYSIVNIPYGSMSAVMTVDGVERTKLANFRSLGSQAALFFSGIFVYPVVDFIHHHSKNDNLSWAVAIGSMTLLGMIFHFLCFKGCKERYVAKPKPKTEIISRKDSELNAFMFLCKNKPFIVFVLFTLLTIATTYIIQQSQLYYFEYQFNAGKEMMKTISTLNMIAFFPIFFTIAVIVKKIGKKAAMAIGAIGFGIVQTLNYFLFAENQIAFLTCMFLSQILIMIPNSVCWAIVADIVEWGEFISGKRTEGIIYSSYSFTRKVCQAIAGFIPGLILSIVGFDPDLATQPEGVLAGIKFTYIALPAMLTIIAGIMFIFFYPLTEAKHREIVEYLGLEKLNTQNS